MRSLTPMSLKELFRPLPTWVGRPEGRRRPRRADRFPVAVLQRWRTRSVAPTSLLRRIVLLQRDPFARVDHAA